MVKKEPAFYRCQQLISQLRDPDTGCPWDKKQTLKSLVPYTLEEAHELIEAIENDDREALKDELGDYLLQFLLYAQISEEEGSFTLEQVLEQLAEKIVRRHPHVFNQAHEDKALNEQEIKAQWEKIKRQEKTNQKKSIFSQLPLTLPSLTAGQKLQKQAARHGFEWRDFSGLIDKLHEEVAEFEALVQAYPDPKAQLTDQAQAKFQDEIGDILFVVTNISRYLGFDAEACMRHANRKFSRRVEAVLAILAEQELDFRSVSDEKFHQLWDDIKKKEKLEFPSSS